MDTVKDKIERLRIKAELFLKNDIRAYIKDIYDTYYFCDILLVGEDKLTIQCFAPEDKKGLKFYPYWTDILEINEYIEEK